VIVHGKRRGEQWADAAPREHRRADAAPREHRRADAAPLAT
jgi:hypothetical protein